MVTQRIQCCQRTERALVLFLPLLQVVEPANFPGSVVLPRSRQALGRTLSNTGFPVSLSNGIVRCKFNASEGRRRRLPLEISKRWNIILGSKKRQKFRHLFWMKSHGCGVVETG